MKFMVFIFCCISLFRQQIQRQTFSAQGQVASTAKFILFFFCCTSLFSQQIQRQTFSAQGKVATTSKGVNVSQSIAQLSVIGSSVRGKVIVAQGFQQSAISSTAKKTFNKTRITAVYPNPVGDLVNIKFSETVSGPISISIFDILGRLVLFQEKEAIQNLLTIDDIALPAGEYLVQLYGNEYTFSTKILISK
jgi:hypothetical protein